MKKSADAHYSTVPTIALAEMDVAALAAPDCALVMWATAPMLPAALDLMEAWGFQFKTAGSWAKRSKADKSWQFGTGYMLRSAAEFFVIGTRGKPAIRSRSIRNLIVSPVREHSRKPDSIYELCEALFDGPRVELFARQRRAGWDAWGLETEKFGCAA